MGLKGLQGQEGKRERFVYFLSLIKKWIKFFSEGYDAIRLHLSEERTGAKVQLCCNLYYKYG